MADRVGPDGEVTGVDPSAPVPEYARLKKPSPGSAPCTYREGIAESLDLADAAKAAVWTSPACLKPGTFGRCRCRAPGR